MKKYLPIILSVFCSCNLYALTYSHVYVFGDSLSDVGYQDKIKGLPKQPQYTSQKGAVWTEYVATLLHDPASPNNLNKPTPGNDFVSGKLAGNVYAAGGATTTGAGIGGGAGHYKPPALDVQISNFLTQNPNLDPKALYIIWAGANDILKALKEGKQVTDIEKAALSAAANIGKDVANLQNRGAQHILLLNMPNLGATPLALLRPENGLAQLLTHVSSTFNDELKRQAQTLSVPIFDDNQLLNKVITSSPNYKITLGDLTITFSNVTQPSCDDQGDITSITALNCIPLKGRQGYLFEDGIHPTGLGHLMLALAVGAFIQQNGV